MDCIKTALVNYHQSYYSENLLQKSTNYLAPGGVLAAGGEYGDESTFARGKKSLKLYRFQCPSLFGGNLNPFKQEVS